MTKLPPLKLERRNAVILKRRSYKPVPNDSSFESDDSDSQTEYFSARSKIEEEETPVTPRNSLIKENGDQSNESYSDDFESYHEVHEEEHSLQSDELKLPLETSSFEDHISEEIETLKFEDCTEAQVNELRTIIGLL